MHLGIGLEDSRLNWTRIYYSNYVYFPYVFVGAILFAKIAQFASGQIEGGMIKSLLSGFEIKVTFGIKITVSWFFTCISFQEIKEENINYQADRLVSFLKYPIMTYQVYVCKILFCKFLVYPGVMIAYLWLVEYQFCPKLLDYFMKYGDYLRKGQESRSNYHDPTEIYFPSYLKCQMQYFAETGAIQSVNAFCIIAQNR